MSCLCVDICHISVDLSRPFPDSIQLSNLPCISCLLHMLRLAEQSLFGSNADLLPGLAAGLCSDSRVDCLVRSGYLYGAQLGSALYISGRVA